MSFPDISKHVVPFISTVKQSNTWSDLKMDILRYSVISRTVRPVTQGSVSEDSIFDVGMMNQSLLPVYGESKVYNENIFLFVITCTIPGE